MSEKTYTLAGTSVLKGVKTMRFATGKPNVRTGVLKRNGHTDIQFFELATPMTKSDAAAWLKDEKGITDAVLPVGRTTKEPPGTAEVEAARAEAKKAEKDAKAKARREAKKAKKAAKATQEPAPAQEQTVTA